MLDYNKVKKGFLAVMLIHLCSYSFGASNRQIELSSGALVKDVTITSKKLSKKELTVLGLTIGKSTLAEVAKQLPNKNLVQKGDAAASSTSLCYVDGKGIALRFNSGEMGGNDKIITDVTIQKDLEKSQNTAVCSLSDKLNFKIDIDALSIGMTKKKVLSLKGKPNKELKDLILYNYESSTGVGDKRIDIHSILELHFVNDKLIKINLSKIESM